MSVKKIGDFTGHSTSDLDEAIENALEKAGEHTRFELLETSCSQGGENNRQFEVTLATFDK